MTGRILAVHSAECEVALEDKVVSCIMRGRLKAKDSSVYAGDIVTVSCLDGQYVIEEVHERRNLLIRPPVANVDQGILVTAVTQPPMSYLYMDRVLLQMEYEGVRGVVCVNKQDIEDPYEIERIVQVYSSAGYECVVTSALTGYGLEKLASILDDKVTVFAGQSGVGKSKLIGSLIGVDVLIGDLSNKGRGRHTTRWVKIFPIGDNGFVADTPGFSRIDLVPVEPHELGFLFPDIGKYAELCHFPRCLHKTEDKCAVKDAVSDGKISLQRYQSYINLLDEAMEQRRY
ncbi:MAG TPA: ribosome small subunit-dependent GTPase A [Bacillota bacterium]|nr:ribosome small subunit-dependent GTPase A [Candidatus Fermentithermobacillaceae bacterium]HOB30092.1 ribosome small subunit-dependent GTPase A [Bacillota bacterium]HOK63982.1 ribosome small subunit-dependent GTPase A [Bacillota bacterium]HOL11337.1 ribosome small subunit-dependent GTPase A [Bacillota bacterium]HOQ02466.1 ribosome small subunit-dependent GTPase A [Bacillota bacterium]